MSSGTANLRIGVVSGTMDSESALNAARMAGREVGTFGMDLGGLVVSSSFKVVGGGTGSTAGPEGIPAVGITGSISTIPDGTALIRAGAFVAGDFTPSTSISLTTGSVSCADGSGRVYTAIGVESSGGAGDVTMSSGTTVDNSLITADGGAGGKAVQQANATINTAGQSLTLNGADGNASPTLTWSADISGQSGDDWTAKCSDTGAGAGTWILGNDAAGSDTAQLTITSTAAGATGQALFLGKIKSGGDVTVNAASTAAASLFLQNNANAGAGDQWQVSSVVADHTLTIGNDIDSAGTDVPMLTITPHATAAQSTVAAAGVLKVGGNTILASDDGSVLSWDVSDNVTVGGKLNIGGQDFIQLAATPAKVALSTTANGATVTIMDLGDTGTASGDLIGCSGTVTLYDINGVTGARKSFHFAGSPSDSTTNDELAPLAVLEAGSPKGIVTQTILDGIKLELAIDTTGSSTWSLQIKNETGAVFTTGGQAIAQAQINFRPS